MDCKYNVPAESSEVYCKYTQGERIFDTTFPDEEQHAPWRTRARVRLFPGNICRFLFKSLPNGKSNFTCNIKTPESNMVSKTSVVEKKLLLPCSAWSVLLQSCSGLQLTWMTLPLLLGINWLQTRARTAVDMIVWPLVSLASFFCYAATGVLGFSVTTENNNVRVKENEGVDLSCQHSADFGSDARVEWKFKDLKGSMTYVIFKGEPTAQYASRVTQYNSNLRFTKVTVRDNGEYDCEVSGKGQFGEVRVKLTVLVAPGEPLCRVPSSVTTGKPALLSCYDNVGSPPPTYKWFKNGVLLPADPKTVSGFKNATYKLNPQNGNLEFSPTTKMDTASYYCVAENEAGPPQQCKAATMEVRDLNTGGIVAGVIIFLLLLALLAFGIWYAYKKGYIPKKSDKPKPNVVYQPQSVYGGDEEDDGDFKQKSSFVV
uniref:Junctional adhesion molecule A n=1 Tax=Knipowitschia caucasica TaxID=637954 RepID=A0AAV2JEM8_KNICA